MATTTEQARLYNEAIAQGLTQQEAINFAGIQNFNDEFVFDDGVLVARVPPPPLISSPPPQSNPPDPQISTGTDAEQSTPVQGREPNPVSLQNPEQAFVFDDNGELIPSDSVQAQAIRISNEDAQARNNATPNTVPTYVEVYNPETGKYDVENLNDGTKVAVGLSEQEATLLAQEYTTDSTGQAAREQATVRNAQINTAANQTRVGVDNAQAQNIINELRKNSGTKAAAGDWRVRLRLAPGAKYLYKDPTIGTPTGSPSVGILQPLQNTDGVIFPYTPKIDLVYHANYSPYDLTHSNYRGYFYQSSYLGEINMTATFTAQDTKEAEYLLAVIHFFRSCTKMFYGSGGTSGPDVNRGAPPPLVYMSGLGQFQFNEHPCLISQFNYSLPDDVDYIRARSSTNLNNDFITKRLRSQSAGTGLGALTSVLARLTGSGLNKGAEALQPTPPQLGLNNPTYVPTRIDISLVLLPVQTRQQVSQQFSLRDYASGKLLNGGFW